MVIEQQTKQYSALNKWFKTPLGEVVAHEISTQFDPVSNFLKGETLLQLGSCGENLWLNSLDFEHKWIVSPFSLDSTISIECGLNQLPLNRNSLDCVIVPLALEPFGNRLNLIDEIDRILKPMGFVVFLSINPWSLWSAALKLGLLKCYADNKVKLRTPFHLNRILLQRGYRQCTLNNFCYIPPIQNKSLIKKLNFVNEVGKMLWPFPSGFYCYIAQKYQYITPSFISQPLQDPIKEFKSPLQPAQVNNLFE
ncbi:MAG: methyltransferase domain-containing protein [Legionella sp.]|nr:methyltransferase domain-containing protein [Legionella sp.]